VIAATLVVALLARPAPPPADPFPIRRVFAPADRLPAAIDQLRAAGGPSSRLPKLAFDALVQSAAARASAPAPRLLEARYRAAFAPDGLTGTVEWRAVGGAAGQLLPLAPLSVALADPSADIVPGPAVHLAAGEQVVRAIWSARAAAGPGADRIELTLPAAPLAVLELDLPADRTPSAPDALVTGPAPGPTGRRLWTIAFGGQTRLDLTVRRPPRPDNPAAVVQLGRAARYELTPGAVAATFAFTPTAVRGVVSEVELVVDARLRVVGVTGPARPAWRVEGTKLWVTAAGGPVPAFTVEAAADFPPSEAGWPLPMVRAVSALPAADAVEIACGPEVKFLGLDPGAYRVAAAQAATVFGIDPGYMVSLVRDATADAKADRPPVVRARPADAEYTSVDDVTWDIGPAQTVTARFRVTVARGPLAALPVRLPAEFTVAAARWSPDDFGLTTSPGPANTVTLTPTRPASGGQTVEVTLDLRGPPPAAGARLPQVMLPGATGREGVLTIRPAAGVAVGASPLLAGPPPWRVAYRGRPPAGEVAVAERPVPVTVDREVTVRAGPTAWTATTAVRLRAAGGLPGVLLALPAGPGTTWEMTIDPGAGTARPVGPLLHAAGSLAAMHPLAALTRAGGVACAGVWLVTPAPTPAGADVTVTATARFPTPMSDVAPVEVPVPVVRGVPPSPIQLRLPPDVLASRTADVAGDRVTLRHRPVGAGGGWQLADVIRTATVGPDGGAAVRLTFAVAGRPVGATGIMIGLPAGAQLEEVRAGGRAADAVRTAGGAVTVPLPAGVGVPVEVGYALPATGGWPLTTVELAPETLPGAPPVRTGWRLPADVRPWPSLDPNGELIDGDTLTTMPADLPHAAAVVLAVLLFGLSLTLTGRRVTAGLGAVVALGGAVALTAPPGWAEVVGPAAGVGLVVLAGRLLTKPAGSGATPRGIDRPRLSSTVTVARPLMLLLAGSAPGAAQAPDAAATVLVTPAPGGGFVVVAPQAVLDRLQALAAPPGSAAVVAADYTVDIASTTAGTAAVEARFTVVAPAAGEQRVDLALSNVRVEAVEVNGRPALATLAPDGYAVTVSGAGQHVVGVRFVVPIAGVGADQEARFGCPDVAATRITLTAPAGARTDVPTRRGVQHFDASTGRPRAVADHGGGRVIAARFRAAAGGPAVAVTTWEACVWDIAADDVTAAAAVIYSVDGGAVPGVRLRLPPGLEPAAPVVRPADGVPVGLPVIRDWRLEPGPTGGKVLVVDFRDPAAGRFAVAMTLTPTSPVGVRPTLRMAQADGATAAEGFLAVRTRGVRLDDLDRRRLIDYPADEPARRFGGIPELALDRVPDRVFQRQPGGPAELRATIHPAADPPAATGEVVWTVGAAATYEASLTVARPAGAAVVEFDWPEAAPIADLRAPGLFVWNRAGGRVQVWLRKPAREVTVKWAGTLAADLPAAGGPVELPTVRMNEMPAAPVRIVPAGGWGVTQAAGPEGGKVVRTPPAVSAPPAVPAPAVVAPTADAAPATAAVAPAVAEPLTESPAEPRWPLAVAWVIGVGLLVRLAPRIGGRVRGGVGRAIR